MALDEQHNDTRGALRVLTVLLIAVGGIFALLGLLDFLGTIQGGGGIPRRFWMVIVGLPLLAIGLRLAKFAFLGKISRYVANEVAPVGRDTIRYLADGTRQHVIGSASPPAIEGSNTCPRCDKPNDLDARFCDSCAAPLRLDCAACATPNDADARFCKSCGKSLSSARAG